MYVLSKSYYMNVALQLLKQNDTGSLAAQPAMADYSFADLNVTLNPGADVAACIMNILLDAQGNADVQVQGTHARVNHLYLSSGDDRVDLNIDEVSSVYTGAGNDTITIKTTGDEGGRRILSVRPVVWGVTSGENGTSQGEDNDTISIESNGAVFVVRGGAGSDNISVASKSDIFVVHGGTGSDVINVVSDEMAQNIMGDGGRETDNSSESLDDIINVTAKKAMNIAGNGGDDTISITAESITWVHGGAGDDHITLNNTGTEAAFLYMNYGDGHDVVETNGALEIALYPSRTDWHFSTSRADRANVTRNDDNTLTISFDDTDNQITVKFTGAMAEADNIVVERDEGKHTLVIRAAN